MPRSDSTTARQGRLLWVRDMPDVSWDAIGELIDRSGRGEAWARTGRWALDVLRARLGEEWPTKARRADPPVPPWSALPWIGGHALALAEVLELALRLELLDDVPGIADVRRELSRDVTAGRSLHSALQLEVAGLAHRLAWAIRLEPAGPASPADVAIATPAGEITVETCVLTERARSREARAASSNATERLGAAAHARGLWLAGELTRIPTDEQLAVIEREILSVDGPGPLSDDAHPGLYLVAADDAVGHVLHGPTITDRLLPRLATAIERKATRQMQASAAGWLRITALTGLWPMTPWGRAPLAEKLELMTDALTAGLGATPPIGIVLSSAAGLAGAATDEIVVAANGVAARRLVAPLRARETLIMPFAHRGDEATGYWLSLVDSECDWLAWALAEAGLASVEEIFAA
jgi:hypothetical protein